MKPVGQESISPQNGDCLRACVASVLEVSGHEVPSVPDYVNEDEGWRVLQAYLRERFGLALIDIHYANGEKPPGYSLASGPDLNNTGRHVAVALNGEVVYDPDPTARGRFRHDNTYGVFVVLDPARMVPA